MTGGRHPPLGHRPVSVAEQMCLADQIKAADESYRRRGELLGGTAGFGPRIERRFAVSDSYELEWRLSRGLFVEAERSPDLYSEGVLHGRRAIELQSDGVEGYFWTGVNLALKAQTTRGLKGAVALLEARRSLRRACDIREAYHGAGPLRVIGRLEHKSPRLLGGSVARSSSYYRRALAIAPTNSVTLVYAAELEIDRGESLKAASLLEAVLSLPIDPDWEFENIRDKTLAKSMLKRLGKHSDDAG